MEAPANDPPRRLRFGLFEVDLRNRELTKSGQRRKLQGQPFQVLTMLLEKPGELVTREELRSRIWPQTVVDFDHGLNKAISKKNAGHRSAAKRGTKFIGQLPLKSFLGLNQ